LEPTPYIRGGTSLPAIIERSRFTVYRERIKFVCVSRKFGEKGYSKDNGSDSSQRVAFRKLGAQGTASTI